jgi:hypothetical protein
MKKYIVIGFVFIILVVLGFIIINKKSSQKTIVTQNIATTTPQITPSETKTQKNIYADPSGDFSIEVPTGASVKPSKGLEIKTVSGTTTLAAPEGSIEIPGVFIISKIPYENISKEKPFSSYSSCCTGTNHWYDKQRNLWEAEKFQSGLYDDNGKALPIKKEVLSLKNIQECTIKRLADKNTYYQLEGTDEGVPTTYSYYFLTDKGYALQLMSLIDVNRDYTKTEASSRPPQSTLDTMRKILSSVQFLNNTKSIVAGCL